MSLVEQQQLFVTLVARLIDFATRQGFALSFGECFRTQEQAEWNAARGLGIANSLHQSRLAIDFIVRRLDDATDTILTTVDQIRPLGDYWCSLHALCRWGGNFAKPDVAHFSSTRGGVQ